VAHSQNDFTRIYGPEDQAVPTPAFVGTVGQQDASALQEITAHRTAVSAASWGGLQATGTLTDVSGNSDQATLTILGTDNFRLDVTTTIGQRSTRICGPSGETLEDDGKTFFLPPITARGGLVAFPKLLASAFPDPTAIIVDRGQVQLDGALLHRITVETGATPTPSSAGATPTPSSAVPALQNNVIRNLNITDFYFDPTSHLLIKMSLASNLGPLVAVNSGPSVAACWTR
jgi:hypothetical protein